MGKPYYQRVSYRLLKRLFRTLDVRLPGRFVTVPIEDDAGLSLLHWSLTWKTRLLAERLRDKPGALIDVGANVGQTLFDHVGALMAGPYVGFEPNPKAATYVLRLIALNRLEATLVPCGLSNRTGLARLSIEAGRSEYTSDATMLPDARPQRSWQGVFVPCFVFDDIRADVAPGPISAIKIDVEGFEGEVLQGMRRTLERDRPALLLEVLHREPLLPEAEYETRVGQLEAYLLGLGYGIQHVEHGEGEEFRLVPVERFQRKVWDDRTSYHECDYYLEPKG